MSCCMCFITEYIYNPPLQFSLCFVAICSLWITGPLFLQVLAIVCVCTLAIFVQIWSFFGHLVLPVLVILFLCTSLAIIVKSLAGFIARILTDSFCKFQPYFSRILCDFVVLMWPFCCVNFASFYSFIANFGRFCRTNLGSFSCDYRPFIVQVAVNAFVRVFCLFIAIFCGADVNCRLHFILGNAF